MRKPIRSLASALALAIPIFFAACSGDDDPVAVAGVIISPNTVTLTKGGPSENLTAAVVPANAANKKLTWTSGDTGKATVTATDSVATVTPVAPTDEDKPVTITATTEDGNKTATCVVTVVEVSSVMLNRDAMALAVGGPDGILTAAVLPTDAYQAVEWGEGSNPAVASVTGAGATATITPLAAGTTIITARSAADLTKTTTCTVTVAPAPEVVAVAPPTLSLAPDATKTITAAVLPVDAPQSVVWASEVPSVATVAGIGDGRTATVTGVAEGTVRITATAAGFPAAFGVCEVTVAVIPAGMTISGGWAHSLGIKADGTLWAWGQNGDGQLGLGNNTNRYVPTQVGHDTHWVSVSGGGYHTLALKDDGSLWAWGLNSHGQLGDGGGGGFSSKNTPYHVGTETDWVAVSAGCWHSMALKSDGSVWTWGGGDWGNLGDGTTDNRNVPGMVGTVAACAAISSGNYHSLAFNPGGELWGWGMNTMGQLGLGDGTTNRLVPELVGTGWDTVCGGGYHTVALKPDGSIWAWGSNSDGQIGDGSSAQRNTPVRVGETHVWKAVRTFYSHSMAIEADGSLWAWGSNWAGQLGIGNTTLQRSPAQVGQETDWAVVVCGAYHSLGIKPNGDLWAWGNNESGAVGDDTQINREAPRKVGEGFRVPAK